MKQRTDIPPCFSDCFLCEWGKESFLSRSACFVFFCVTVVFSVKGMGGQLACLDSVVLFHTGSFSYEEIKIVIPYPFSWGGLLFHRSNMV